MKKIGIAILIFLVIATGCSSGSSKDMGLDEDFNVEASSLSEGPSLDSEMLEEGGIAQGGGRDTDIEAKLIKEGNMRLEVDDALRVAQQIKETVAGLKGYISDESQHSYYRDGREYLSLDMSARIPDSSFDAFIKELESYGKIAHKQVSVVDVTEQYVDLEARLQALKEAEQRFVEIFAEADTVEEMLAVESELTRLRQDIESLEGQFRYLKNRVSLSNMYISIEEVQTKSASFGALSFSDTIQNIGSSFTRGIYSFLRMLGRFINNLAYLLPSLIFLSLVGWGVYLPIRRYRRRKHGLNTSKEKNAKKDSSN